MTVADAGGPADGRSVTRPPAHRRRRRWVTAAAAAGLATSGALVAVTPGGAAGAVPRGALGAVPASAVPTAWVRSSASVPAVPVGSRAEGAVAASTSVHADVVLEPRDAAALSAFDTAVSTPGSASFRHYLAPGAFGGVFGATPATIASVRRWLEGGGLAVGPTARDGLVIPVSGTAAQVGRAFDVGLEQYRLPSGRTAHAPTAGPLVPGALAGSVAGVVGLDDLTLPVPELARPDARTTRAVIPGRSAAPLTAAGAAGAGAPRLVGTTPRLTGPVPTAGCQSTINGQSSGALTADKLAQAYSFGSVYSGGNEGAGVTVGMYELEPFKPSDIATYEACYSPAITASVAGVSVDGANPNVGPQGGEAALDIEMVAGMAPQSSIRVYVGPNGGSGPIDTYVAMVDDSTLPQVISTSWGQCEAQTAPVVRQIESAIFQQAVAQGQTVTAAAGDEGSEDCFFFPSSSDTRLQDDDPASQPWVTGVGGTTVSALGPAPTESVWNSGLFAGTGGGGVSTTWTMPAWQRGPGVQSVNTASPDTFTGAQPCAVSSGAGTASCRQVPDVAADADPHTGFAVFCSCFGGWAKIGGTSMSSPLWGALVALADQGMSSPVGFINPVLYQARCDAVAAFNDVTVGNNQPAGSQPANAPHQPGEPYYPATPGYDLATGLGTPIASTVVSTLQSPPSIPCPATTGISTTSGRAGGGTLVTITGSSLSGVTEVDVGGGNPAAIVAQSNSAVTVRTPASPTGGWATVKVLVKAGADVLGYDGSLPFSYIGPQGYWEVASDGGIFTFGQLGFHGSMGGIPLNQPIVGMASTPSSGGYWEVASDGGIFAFGDAGFYGSTGATPLNRPVVGMAATPDGRGYWEVASDGGIFSFGDAAFYGSTGGLRLNKPVVAMVAAPDGGGYWLVASDGGIFAFGDAAFHGSMGGSHLNQPVVGMAATPDGNGYWEVASDGGIFSFGDAAFHGSTGGTHLNRPVVAMAATPDGNGYWEVAADGGVFAFGGRYGGFFGSMGGSPLNQPMVGVGAPPDTGVVG